jgi:hypothetical protein
VILHAKFVIIVQDFQDIAMSQSVILTLRGVADLFKTLPMPADGSAQFN